MSLNKWLPSIGLEIHAQIISSSKLFSEGAVNVRNRNPNTNIALFDVAIPGTLPVLNASCVKAGVLTALAVGSRVNLISYFDRKHYFYPDLPAGYQITQKRQPLATGGLLTVPVQGLQQFIPVRLKQLQLEQDSGKITYGETTGRGGRRETLVDYNRAGVGLMEIVTEPDMKSGAEAAAFVKELRQILMAIHTCDGNIQDGSLRVDANISVRRSDCPTLGVRTEIKNVSGFRVLAKAVDYEIKRQIETLEADKLIKQETRSYNERKGITIASREKTDQQDYCFMAEHDLPPIVLYSDSSPPPLAISSSDNVINIDKLLNTMPELPSQTRKRFLSDYGLSTEQVHALMSRDNAVDYFEEVKKHCSSHVTNHSVLSLITSQLYGLLENTTTDISNCPVSTKQMVSVLNEVSSANITSSLGKEILKAMYSGDKRLATDIVKDMSLLTDEELHRECLQVIRSFTEQVEQFNSGKFKVLGFLVGQVIKRTNKGTDPQNIKDILIEEMKKLE